MTCCVHITLPKANSSIQLLLRSVKGLDDKLAAAQLAYDEFEALRVANCPETLGNTRTPQTRVNTTDEPFDAVDETKNWASPPAALTPYDTGCLASSPAMRNAADLKAKMKTAMEKTLCSHLYVPTETPVKFAPTVFMNLHLYK